MNERETFPERVERIRVEHNVSWLTARRVASAESRIERAKRARADALKGAGDE